MFAVLVLDDDPRMRWALSKDLRRLGFVPVAPPIPTDLDSFRRGIPDLVHRHRPVAALIDVGLHRQVGGPGLVELLLEESPRTKVLLLTGDAEDRALNQGDLLFGADVPLLAKSESLAADLERELRCCCAGQPDLGQRIRSYLQTLLEAVDLRLASLPERCQRMVERLDFDRDYLLQSADHRSRLGSFLEALCHDWPPSCKAIREHRREIERLAELLDPASQAEFSHYLTHEVTNNFLLGWEVLQHLLQDVRTPTMLLESAASDASIEPPLRQQLAATIEALNQYASTGQVECLGALAQGLRRVLPEGPVVEPQPPLYLKGWGEVKRFLLVENDAVLGPILRMLLRERAADLPTRLCSDRERHAALQEEGTYRDRPFLDLSLPRRAGEGAETAEHGLAVLSRAHELKVPSLVFGGVTRVPALLQRCLDLRPLAFLAKNDLDQLLDNLGELFQRCPLPEAPEAGPHDPCDPQDQTPGPEPEDHLETRAGPVPPSGNSG